MIIAKDSFGEGVTLAGSPRFKDETIRVAADCDFPMEFSDPADRKAVGERNEERQHERDHFRQHGGKIFRPADLHQHAPAGTGKREQSLSFAPAFDISSLANCPNAVWMVVDSEMLQCFCTIMHTAS